MIIPNIDMKSYKFLRYIFKILCQIETVKAADISSKGVKHYQLQIFFYISQVQISTFYTTCRCIKPLLI